MSDNKKERLNEKLVEVIRDEKTPAQIRLKKLKYLVALGADINANVYGKSAILWAKEVGDADLIDFLSEKEREKNKEANCKNVKPNVGEAKTAFPKTVATKIVVPKIVVPKIVAPVVKNAALDDELLQAVKKGDNLRVKKLIQSGADVNIKDEYGNTPLVHAAIFRHTKMVEELLDGGADVNIKGQNEYSALIRAAEYGFKEIVEMLIKKGADVNATNNHGTTALMFASYDGHLEVVNMLLDNGADIDIRDDEGVNAFDCSVLGMRKNVEKALREYITQRGGQACVSIYAKKLARG